MKIHIQKFLFFSKISILLLILSLLLISCAFNIFDLKPTVTFICDDTVWDTINLEENTVVDNVPTPKKEGFIFLGWYTSAALDEKYDFSSPISGNLKLYARFEKIHTISFYVNNKLWHSQKVQNNHKTSAPENPSIDGRVFVGWYTDINLSEEFDFSSIITEDLKLYASFKTIYLVSFVSDNQSWKRYSVEEGNTIQTPPSPSKANYIFVGWYTDSTYSKSFDFSKPIYSDLTLYAKYSIDAASLTNKITTSVIQGVVTVTSRWYNSFLGVELNSSGGQGSGVVFYTRSGRYYVLTNEHVVTKPGNYKKHSITIEDYQGNTYEGGLVAISPEDDLAIIVFEPQTDFKLIALSNTTPSVGDDVIALGSPKGQSNAITFGTIQNYGQYSTLVDCDIITHTAKINHGSSGGALLNSDLQLIGVNFSSNDDLTVAGAIPISQVRTFIKNHTTFNP